MSWSLILQMGGEFGGMGSVAFIGPFFGILVMGGLLYVLWSAMTGETTGQTTGSPPKDAMETLRERYARGEISEEEFQERARRLREP